MDEIPEGLDDLLNSILGKKKSNPSGGSSALAISSKAKKKQSVKEDNIEEIILRLLGLDDVSDIDYDTYKTLLREKMAAGRMSNSQMPTEEVELLTNEFKRVKSKTGRFKPKPKKKVKADAFFSGAIQKKSSVPKKTAAAVSPKTNLQDDVINEIQKIKPDDSSAFIENTLVPQVNKISENLNSIVDTLNKQFQLEKKSEKKEASAADTLKKKTRETKLETPEKDNKFKSAAKAALKPASNFFDMILDFFKNILLGGALLGLIEILKDPSKAFQPFVDFVNKFIDFINSISTWTNENILGPINDFIGGIFDAFNALEDNVNKALALFGADPIDNIKEEDKPVLSIPMIEPYENPFAAPEPEPVTGLDGGSLVTDSTGQKISGMGADTQLVALSPGEVVMSNKAGDMYGRDNLLAANAAAGGTNRPKIGKGGLLGFSEGGGYNIRRATSRDVGAPTMGAAPLGLMLVPGHGGYGGGTPGETSGLSKQKGMASGWDEYLANVMIGKNVVQQVKGTNPGIPIQFYEKPGGFENSTQGFKDAIAHYKDLEKQGYEVIEIHHDAPKGAGGLIGSYTNYSKLDKRLAEIGGNFGAGYKGRFETGYGMAKAGISIFEVAPLSGRYEQGLILGDNNAINAGSAPLIQAITEVYGGSITSVPLSDPTQQQVQMRPSNAPLTAPGAPDGRGRTRVVILPPGGQNPGANPNSASSGSQSTLPKFSATDPRNTELIVIKSIYNIVG